LVAVARGCQMVVAFSVQDCSGSVSIGGCQVTMARSIVARRCWNSVQDQVQVVDRRVHTVVPVVVLRMLLAC